MRDGRVYDCAEWRRLPFLSILLSVLCCLSVCAGETRGGLALCVGISGYRHLEPLEYAARDAVEVAEAFRSGEGFRRVLVLSDVDASDQPSPARFLPTRRNILDMVRLLANNAGRDDILAVFFSGHGMMDDGVAYLMPMDAEPQSAIDPDAGIALDSVLEILGNSRAKHKLLLVDANNDAELFPGLDGTLTLSSRVHDDSVTLIVSCDAGQRALVDAERGMGLFALAVSDALSGDGSADRNGDALLSGGELHAFLESYMGEYCLERLIISGQTPQMCSGDPEHPFVTGYGAVASKTAPAEPDAPADRGGSGEDAEEGVEEDGAVATVGDSTEELSSASVYEATIEPPVYQLSEPPMYSSTYVESYSQPVYVEPSSRTTYVYPQTQETYVSPSSSTTYSTPQTTYVQPQSQTTYEQPSRQPSSSGRQVGTVVRKMLLGF